MSGGTDNGTRCDHGRHRRVSDGGTWTPTVPPGAEDDTLPGRHVAPLGNGRPPAQRTRVPGATAQAARTGRIAAVDRETFPNLRPAKHEAPVSGSAPAAVLAPVEYLGTGGYDPLTDTGASGLRKFDLGSVPASVTPPRSWRKAAWFSVAASAAALAGLVAVSSTFVGGSTRSTIGALPGLPPNTALPTPSPPGEKAQPAPAPGDSTARDDAAAGTPQRSRPGSAASRAVAVPGPTDSAGGSTARAPRRGTGTDTGSTSPDSGTTEPPTGSDTTVVAAPPPVDTDTTIEPSVLKSGDDMDGEASDRTATAFYDEVAEDPGAALASYASPEMTSAERAAIRGRYADVEYVRVPNRTVDEGERTAVSTVTLYYADGSHREATRTLEFTGGDDPKIVSES